MRHVLSNPYHLWAHQRQEWARNSGDTMSFRGKSAYSYRAEIGRIVENDRGERAYLLCATSYSVTTSRHQSELRRAIPPSSRIFHVQQLERFRSAESEAERYQSDITELFAKSKRARKYGDIHLARAQDMIEELAAFCEFFHLEFKLQDYAQLAEELNEARARAEVERKRIAAENRIKAQESIQRWQAGEPIQCPYVDGEQFLRLKDSETVETSLRAEVPLSHVLRIIPHVLKLIRDGRGFAPEYGTVRLGHYHLTAISPEGTVHVGCHKFLKAEVLRFACVLGVCGE